jgi:hypothetical protein
MRHVEAAVSSHNPGVTAREDTTQFVRLSPAADPLRVRTRAPTAKRLRGGRAPLHVLCAWGHAPLHVNDLALIRPPIFGKFNKSWAHRILSNVLPFLCVTFVIAQKMIEEIRLPKGTLLFAWK